MIFEKIAKQRACPDLAVDRRDNPVGSVSVGKSENTAPVSRTLGPRPGIYLDRVIEIIALR